MNLIQMPKKIKKKLCQCGTTPKLQMDMILFEVRENRKDILELKEFMNKSKGTLAVVLFLAGVIGAFIGMWNYIKWNI